MGPCSTPCFWFFPESPPWPLGWVGGYRGCCLAGDRPCRVLSSVCGAHLAEPRSTWETLCMVGGKSGPLGWVLLDSQGWWLCKRSPQPCLAPSHACRHPFKGCCSLPIPGAAGHAQGEEGTGSLPRPLVPRDALLPFCSAGSHTGWVWPQMPSPLCTWCWAPMGSTPGLDPWAGCAWGGRGQRDLSLWPCEPACRAGKHGGRELHCCFLRQQHS